MKGTKRTGVIAIVLAMILSLSVLAGAGKGNGDDGNNPPPSPTQTDTVKVEDGTIVFNVTCDCHGWQISDANVTVTAEYTLDENADEKTPEDPTTPTGSTTVADEDTADSEEVETPDDDPTTAEPSTAGTGATDSNVSEESTGSDVSDVSEEPSGSDTGDTVKTTDKTYIAQRSYKYNGLTIEPPTTAADENGNTYTLSKLTYTVTAEGFTAIKETEILFTIDDKGKVSVENNNTINVTMYTNLTIDENSIVWDASNKTVTYKASEMKYAVLITDGENSATVADAVTNGTFPKGFTLDQLSNLQKYLGDKYNNTNAISVCSDTCTNPYYHKISDNTVKFGSVTNSNNSRIIVAVNEHGAAVAKVINKIFDVTISPDTEWAQSRTVTVTLNGIDTSKYGDKDYIKVTGPAVSNITTGEKAITDNTNNQIRINKIINNAFTFDANSSGDYTLTMPGVTYLFNVANIDNTAPTVSGVPNGNGNVINQFTVIANDNEGGSGIANVYMSTVTFGYVSAGTIDSTDADGNPIQLNKYKGTINGTAVGDEISAEGTTDKAAQDAAIAAAKDVFNKNKDKQNYLVDVLNKDNATIDGNKYTFSIEGNEEYDAIAYWAEDNAGNISDIEVYQPENGKITIDNTAPVVNNVTVVTLNNLSYSNSREITINAKVSEDHLATVTANLYQKATDGGEDKLVEEKIALTDLDKDGKYTATITVADGDNYYVKVTAVDKAGNETTVSDEENPFTVDTIAPAVSDVNVVTLNTGRYNKTGKITISAVVSDAHLATVTAKLYDQNNNVVEEYNKGIALTDPDKDGTYKATIEVDDGDNYYVTVTAKDYAGNETTVSDKENPFTVDTTFPKMTECTFNPADCTKDYNFFNKDRVLTITFNEHHYASGCFVYIDSDGEEKTEPFAFAANESTGNLVDNGDDSYTFKKTFNDVNGDAYTPEEVKLTDEAGNVTTYNLADGTVTEEGYPAYKLEAFVVDTTVPQVSVEYNKITPSNGKYFNADRYAIITVNEHNFNYDKYVKTSSQFDKIKETELQSGVYIIVSQTNKDDQVKDGNYTIAKEWVDVEENADTHTLRIDYSGNVNYTFNVVVVDKAGNISADPNYDGNKDFAPEANDNFDVDKVITAPTITGVSGGSAYNGNVTGNVNYSDANFQNATIRLTRADRNSVYDVTAQHTSALPTGGTGGDVQLVNFDRVLSNDGIYTLTATITDKAGNTAENSVTFSVNRFGSTYQFDDYLSSICDKHITAVTGDLKITEINPDSLSDGSVTITHNGKVIKNDVKAVLQKSGSASGGWYEYLYTISKDKFTEDGLYTIVINSKDAAGNEPSSQNDNTAEIKFWVDDTKSELSGITGLEEAIINGEKQDVTFSISDNIGLKSVVVYCDGKVIATFGEDDFTAGNLKDAVFTIDEASSAQHIRIVAEDQSGNVFDTDEDDTLTFEHDVTVSTNFFVRWFANKPLFFGSIAAIVIIGAGIWFAVAKKKKNED